MDSLGELVDVLAAQPSTAAPRLRGILSLSSSVPNLKQLSTTKNAPLADASPQLTPRQLDNVLALARFLAASQGQFRQQLLPHVLGFVKALLVTPAAAADLSARSPFFPKFLKPLFDLARVDAESQKSISGAIAEILQEITKTTQLSQGEEPLLPVVQDFLAALGEGPLPLLGDDAEHIAKWLHERWIGGPQGSSSSGVPFRANGQHINGEHGQQANGKGDMDGPLPGSRSPSVASLSESSDDISELHLRGSRSSGSLTMVVDEGAAVLERREWAFRIFAQLLPQARVNGGPTDAHVLGAFRDRASKQLKMMVHTLQVSFELLKKGGI